MALQEYARKRNFEQTPEPGALLPKHKNNRLMFCVQRHNATQLHYDFRLEMEGVLKSWAVPKGPSMRAGDKRLAMMVEDHPFDYGDFEGIIPEGNYGAGSVMLWDTGYYELLGDLPGLKQIGRGDLKFYLYGEKLCGEFALVHMKGDRHKDNEWLLIKKRDQEADEDWDIEKKAFSVLTGLTQEQIAAGAKAKKKRKPRLRH